MAGARVAAVLVQGPGIPDCVPHASCAKVLAEIGLELAAYVEIRVLDSSSHSRWFVLPEQPSGTEDFTDDMLMDLVTTESMMGVCFGRSAT